VGGQNGGDVIGQRRDVANEEVVGSGDDPSIVVGSPVGKGIRGDHGVMLTGEQHRIGRWRWKAHHVCGGSDENDGAERHLGCQIGDESRPE